LDSYSDLKKFPVSPRLGVIYRTSEQSALKVLYGTGFRAPYLVEQRGAGGLGGVKGGGSSLAPEYLKSYELDWIWIERGLRITFGSFFTAWDNQISQGLDSVYRNLSKSRAYGLDLSLEQEWGLGWKTFSNLTFARSFTTNSTGAQMDYQVIPRVIWNWGGGYRQGAWEFSLYSHHRMGHGDRVEGVITQLPPYFRTDCSLYYDIHRFLGLRLFEKAQFGFTVQNLFNRQLVSSSVGDLKGGVPESRIQVMGVLQLQM
jgi:outer membrane receptor protein involved in Fe transport